MQKPIRHYGELIYSDKYVRRRLSQGFDLIKDEIREEAKILDVGGYMGDFFEFIKNQKGAISRIDYCIVDYDRKAMEVAKQRGAETIEVDFNNQKLREVVGNRKFDIIICTEVLEHLLEPKRYLEEFSPLLNEGGRCLISLPNENTIFHRIYALLGLGIDSQVFKPYKHLHFPTIRQSKHLVSGIMKIEAQCYYINLGGKGTSFNFLAGALQIIPDGFWQFLADAMPGLFARGTIFKLKK